MDIAETQHVFSFEEGFGGNLNVKVMFNLGIFFRLIGSSHHLLTLLIQLRKILMLVKL